MVCGLAFVVCYFAVPRDAAILGIGALNLALGVSLGLSLLLIGLAAIQWSKKLMTDREIVEERHEHHSSAEERAEVLGMLDDGAEDSQFGRRPLIRRCLFASLGVLVLPPIILLKDLGPLPDGDPSHTIWPRASASSTTSPCVPVKAAGSTRPDRERGPREPRRSSRESRSRTPRPRPP